MNNDIFCRFCRTPLTDIFADLGLTPIANDIIPMDAVNKEEVFYPLHAYICRKCLLVQLPNVVSREAIFNDHYSYFSSYSTFWLDHAQKYVAMIMTKLGLNKTSLVVELASNDGYLLQYFLRDKVPVLGVEPSANVAAAAVKKGIRTEVKFFGKRTATELVQKYRRADLIIANNVLAHVPDLNDFIGGIKLMLKPAGTATIEFPHLLNLIAKREFDTIYHEHYSYFSLLALDKIFSQHGLAIFDVEELPTHGGSLRIYVGHFGQKKLLAVAKLQQKEIVAGLGKLSTYTDFQNQISGIKFGLLKFLIKAKEWGKIVAGYGAPAKGNTLLNYCGIRSDLVRFTVDKSPHKQNHFLPGSRIPIYAPGKIFAAKPDYVLILPWNLKAEIIRDLNGIKRWGGRFVVPVPSLKVIKP